MFNCYMVKKRQNLKEQRKKKQIKEDTWILNYQDNVRPSLLEKYNRRVNNFIVRLEDDKKQLYQYRQQTESKAHQLLKEIYRKQKFVGDPTIKLRDNNDWNSLLSPTERIDKIKNKEIFEKKFGNASLAFRSIASQSVYTPAGSIHFRKRDKKSELSSKNMRFTSKCLSFNENKREEVENQKNGHSRTMQIGYKEGRNDEEYNAFRRKSSSNQTGLSNSNFKQDEINSHSNSILSGIDSVKNSINDDTDQQESTNKEHPHRISAQRATSSKVYFKQIVDLEQHMPKTAARKSLHQILVRFGVSRIKDLKKQAMVQTDNLNIDQL